ncbi:hypothetical protein Vadar_027624 [Vaccinium darrowii]|uniref:Uncharacterized protein n=1 Tax=Vaccinium darrowii TaxID=229202 RepID=A0ACB7YZ58_9ERIC|nr:hypothetical protein Vadar_027624 [Vaccinium darrowii]
MISTIYTYNSLKCEANKARINKKGFERTYESGAQTVTLNRLVETSTRTIARKPGASIPSSLVTIIVGLSPAPPLEPIAGEDCGV